MVENEVGLFNDLILITCFLILQKHCFGIHMDKSHKICTHVGQIFNKVRLLLNMDVTVAFLN